MLSVMDNGMFGFVSYSLLVTQPMFNEVYMVYSAAKFAVQNTKGRSRIRTILAVVRRENRIPKPENF